MECVLLSGATNPQIIIYGYGKVGKNRYACLIGIPLSPDVTATKIDGAFAEAIFNLVDEGRTFV